MHLSWRSVPKPGRRRAYTASAALPQEMKIASREPIARIRAKACSGDDEGSDTGQGIQP